MGREGSGLNRDLCAVGGGVGLGVDGVCGCGSAFGIGVAITSLNVMTFLDFACDFIFIDAGWCMLFCKEVRTFFLFDTATLSLSIPDAATATATLLSATPCP